MNKIRIAYLTLVTFEGIAPFAFHYTAELRVNDQRHEVTWSMSAEKAKCLNKAEGYNLYHEGWTSNRFPNKQEAHNAGVMLFKTIVNDGALILGSNTCAEPQPIIATTGMGQQFAELAKPIIDKHLIYVNNGDWQKNEREMLITCALWDELIEKWTADD